MFPIPRKEQYDRWSLPSKITYWGFISAMISLFLTIILPFITYLLSPTPLTKTDLEKSNLENIENYFGILSPYKKRIIPYDKKEIMKIEFGWDLNHPGIIFEYSGGALSKLFDSQKNKKFFKVFDEINLSIDSKDGNILVSAIIRNPIGEVLAILRDNEWEVPPPPQTLDRNFTKDILEVINIKNEVILQIRLHEDKVQINGVFYSSEGYGIALQPSLDGKSALMITLDKDSEIRIEPLFVYPSKFHLGELRKSKFK